MRAVQERSSEVELIQAAQRGDSGAFEQLVRSYDQSVLRMALNLLHSEEDARDVYQEVFLRVYRNLPKFRFDCAFSTWLYRIVANLCLDQIRKRKVRREEPAAVGPDGGEVDRLQSVPEKRADVDPQRRLMSAEVNARVQDNLEKLTPRERLVFEMRHFQGMRLKSIGDSLGSYGRSSQKLPVPSHAKDASGLGRPGMTCPEAQASLSLYLYGELDFAAEEALEIHVDDCALCQLALNREKEWHAALNRQQRDVSPEWLAACRTDLYRHVAAEPTTAAQFAHRAKDRLLGLFDFRFTERSYRTAAVSFLLLLGFGAGRMLNSFSFPWGKSAPGNAAGFIDPPVTQVRQIQPESGNRVRIIMQRSEMREISATGTTMVSARYCWARRGNRWIRVCASIRWKCWPGRPARKSGMRLVNTVRNDTNAAVRLKAVESLRQFPGDPVTRDALEFALAHDSDAGVRTEAMDVLVPVGGNVALTPQLFQIISDVMRSAQDDDYVRLRCAQILRSQSSSNGVY